MACGFLRTTLRVVYLRVLVAVERDRIGEGGGEGLGRRRRGRKVGSGPEARSESASSYPWEELGCSAGKDGQRGRSTRSEQHSGYSPSLRAAQ